MSSTQSRIGVIGWLVGFGLGALLLHLWFLMVHEHEVWARRSHENHLAFRSVPSRRGAILDRTGKVLAYDQPTMQASLYYQRFRQRHPVGAAVHGATTWARLQQGGELVTYGYLEGVLGPEAAARDLLAIPVRMLRPGVLDRRVAAELASAATTVLSACADVPRKHVATALRTGAQRPGSIAIGDVLPGITAEALLDNHARIIEALRRFERELQTERRARTAPGAADAPILFAELERLRRASLSGEKVLVKGRRDGAVGTAEEPVFGHEVETIGWPFAEHVSFELAASLRIGGESHPGIEVAPSAQRIVVEPDRTSLRALLGAVAAVGRAELADKSDKSADKSRPVSESPTWLDRYVDELPKDWLDDFGDAATTPAERDRMQQDAMAGFRRATRLSERRGIGGIERSFDATLTGRLGLRLVEHDATRREQTLWSNLRVESGNDVALTIDLDLQRLVEPFVQRARESMMTLHADEMARARVEASLAVIDARSGDILALAGAPVTGNAARQVPGVVWHGNGALGSVVKPFVLVEQLEAEALGRPCVSIAALQPCSGSFVYAGRTFRCEHHWQDGCDPVAAIGKSCNSFFYQCAVGLGSDGVARALQRFGLQASAAGSPFAACWQKEIAGLHWYAPQRTEPAALPDRAIGYGVSASPLAVARAYAALATGTLPKLGLRRGEPRPGVLLQGLEAEIEVARQGLAACVANGTARDVRLLSDFQVMGKTGTAEVGEVGKENNAWFAGFLPWTARDGVQLCFCAVIYRVPHGEHGGDAAARLVADLLAAIHADHELKARYVTPEGGR